MNEHELRQYLRAFHYWREQAQGQVQRCARTRMLFLCLLIRYSGMRLGEALAFDDVADLDEASCMVRVRGRSVRFVPLARRAMKKLCELRDAPAVLREKGRLCRMDQGYVRRIFEARAEDAGLPFRVNPSLVRRAREDELRRMGVEPEALEYLFGRRGSLGQGDMEKVRQILRYREHVRRAGLHNVFQGEVDELERREHCTRLVILTSRGLLLHVRCSTRTASKLALETREFVTASFRSLQARLSDKEDGVNSFFGRVIEVHNDGADIKVMLELSSGDRCCVILEAREDTAYQPGQDVWLCVDESAFQLSWSDQILSKPMGRLEALRETSSER